MMLQNKMKYVFLEEGFFEKNTEESLTVPDEALTVREIMERFVRGQPLSLHSRSAHYSDNEIDSVDLEEVQRMDFAERADLKERLGGFVKGFEPAPTPAPTPAPAPALAPAPAQ